MKKPISVLYALALALTLFGCKADYSDLESTVFDIPVITSGGVYESLNESLNESETKKLYPPIVQMALVPEVGILLSQCTLLLGRGKSSAGRVLFSLSACNWAYSLWAFLHRSIIS